jgi:hypothetical protein
LKLEGKMRAVLIGLLCAGAGYLPAQQTNSVASIERAAAAYAAAHYVTDSVVFDTVALKVPHTSVSAGRTRDEIVALGNTLHATRLGSGKESVRCTAPEINDCRLSNANAIVSLSRPLVVGDTAYVTVQTIRDGYQKRNLFRRTDRLMLVKQPAGWLVVKSVARSVS